MMIEVMPPDTFITVVVVDQFYGPSPYDLQQAATRGEYLTVADCQPGGIMHAAYTRWAGACPREPLILRVHETFEPEPCTTVLRPDARGRLEFWKARWDTD